MGQQYYQLDTNTVIDYLNGKLPAKINELLDNIVAEISVITRMELLGWPSANPSQLQVLESFIENAIVHPLEEKIILQTIDIRRKYKCKLPDAIIAATALEEESILISRNINDFRQIRGLQLIDPYNFGIY